jgi:hypothetical protein
MNLPDIPFKNVLAAFAKSRIVDSGQTGGAFRLASSRPVLPGWAAKRVTTCSAIGPDKRLSRADKEDAQPV